MQYSFRRLYLATYLGTLLPYPLYDAHLDRSRSTKTYMRMKQVFGNTYQQARDRLVGEGGPFSGWVHTGMELQNFDLNGEEYISNDPEKLCTHQQEKDSLDEFQST